MGTVIVLKPLRSILVAILLASLLGACASNSSCDELTVPRSAELFSIRGAESVTRASIGELFGLAKSQVAAWRVIGGGLEALWTAGNREYHLTMEEPKLTVRWTAASPSLGRVLECLGVPDRYQAETLPTPDGVPYHSLSLWYESRNVAAEVSSFGLPWGYSDLQATDRLVFVNGTTWQERLESAYGRGSFPVMGSVRSLRAWPGNLSRIVVGNDPWLR